MPSISHDIFPVSQRQTSLVFTFAIGVSMSHCSVTEPSAHWSVRIYQELLEIIARG
jgi:hypothetical protein